LTLSGASLNRLQRRRLRRELSRTLGAAEWVNKNKDQFYENIAKVNEKKKREKA